VIKQNGKSCPLCVCPEICRSTLLSSAGRKSRGWWSSRMSGFSGSVPRSTSGRGLRSGPPKRGPAHVVAAREHDRPAIDVLLAGRADLHGRVAQHPHAVLLEVGGPRRPPRRCTRGCR